MDFSERWKTPIASAPDFRQESVEKEPELPTGREEALAALRAAFENPEDPDNELEYHAVPHTEGVAARTDTIAVSLGLTGRRRTLAAIGAYWHDRFQDWYEEIGKNGWVVRERKLGESERRSADAAEAWMREQGVFTDADIATVREAILVTIPGWDKDRKTVMQTGLTRDTSLEARSVAFADIGTAGMDPELFGKEGAQLFAERELGIKRALLKAEKVTDIPEPLQQKYLAAYIEWMDLQPAFAAGRQARFELETEGLEPHQIEGLRTVFTEKNFERSIEIATQNAEEARTLTFEEFARKVFPSIFVEEVKEEATTGA